MRKFSGLLLLLFCVLGLSAGDKLFNTSSERKVFYVSQFMEFNEISSHELQFLKRVLHRAKQENVRAVIFELDTPGGSVNVAYKYLSVLAKSEVPVIAYLHPNGISAGAIIALGADRIAIKPEGMIGDAMPLQLGPGGTKPITERPASPKADEKKPPESKTEKTDTPADKTDAPTDKDKAEKNVPKLPAELDEVLRKLQDTPKPSASDEELLNQKFLTVFFKALQILAEKNDRPVRVVRAMADPYQRLTEEQDGIVHDKVSPLTLSAAEAKKLNVVDYIARDRHDLVSQLGLADCEIIAIAKGPLEQVVTFLTYPAIAGVLLMIGLVGLYVEVKTPGFGVPGILGLSALTLFFLGHVGSGASDWGPMVVFVVGLILLLLEIFVIPGFGIIGILGIVCVVTSFFMAFGWEKIETAAYVISLSMLAAIGIMVILAFYLTKPMFRMVALDSRQLSSDGYTAFKDALVAPGDCGVTVSMLRPAGIAMIDGKRLDVMTEGSFIEADVPVQVTDIRGGQIIVNSITQPINHKENNQV
jgi:membrane-bound serine protease (ClpP class)